MGNQRKQVVILVGPKGAGKSTIGHFLATELGIHFLRVEPLFLALLDEMEASNPAFERRGFESVFEALSEALAQYDVVCFESTGASALLGPMLDRLGHGARVIPIKVSAPPALCLERVHTRDASIHIPVSDDRVERINAMAFGVKLSWAAEIDNGGDFPASFIKRTVRALLCAEGGAVESLFTEGEEL